MGYAKFIRDVSKYLGVKCNVVSDMTIDEMKRMALEKKLPPADVRLVDKKTKESTILFTLGQPPQDQAKRKKTKARPKSRRAVRLTW